MLIEAFNSIKAKTSTIFHNLFSNTNGRMITDIKAMPVGTSKDIQDASNWLQREKFLNFTDLEVACPVGMSVNYLTYITTLETVWMNYISILDEGLFTPLSKNLGIVANDPQRALTKLTIRELNQSYPLYKTKPETVKGQLSKCLEGPKVGTTKMGKVFNSGTNYEAVLLRALELRQLISDKEVSKLKRNIESVNSSIDAILENEIDAKLAEHLHNEVLAASQWVELYGVFMLQVDEAFNALRETQKKINALSKK